MSKPEPMVTTIATAAASWAGRGRRRARRGIVAGALVAALVLAGSGLARLSAGDVDPAGTPSPRFPYAVRVDGMWTVKLNHGRELKLHQGKVAAYSWPAGSPDGRWLAYAVDDGPYVAIMVRDLRGTRVPPTSQAPVAGPYFWSPDSRRVFVPVVDGDYEILDTRGGPVVHSFSPGMPAGFVDDRSLGWVTGPAGGEDPLVELRYLVTDLRGNTMRSMDLDLDASGLEAGTSWTMALSPGRTRLAVQVSHGGSTQLAVFSTEDGSVVSPVEGTRAARKHCPARWEGERVVPQDPAADCLVQLADGMAER